jgi:hypothetical protein
MRKEMIEWNGMNEGKLLTVFICILFSTTFVEGKETANGKKKWKNFFLILFPVLAAFSQKEENLKGMKVKHKRKKEKSGDEKTIMNNEGQTKQERQYFLF